MSLFETTYPNNERTISGLNNPVFNDDVVLNCDTSSGAVSINLNSFTSGNWNTLYKLYIVDASNNAGTNNITINAPVGFTIDGQSSIVISQNGGSVIVRISSNTGYVSTLGQDFNVLDTYDSGWKDIPSYDPSSGYGMVQYTATGFPNVQFRVIGRIVHLKGLVIIPLDNGSGGYATNYLTMKDVVQTSPAVGASVTGWSIPSQEVVSSPPLLPSNLRPGSLGAQDYLGNMMYLRRYISLNNNVGVQQTNQVVGISAISSGIGISFDSNLVVKTTNWDEQFGNGTGTRYTSSLLRQLNTKAILNEQVFDWSVIKTAMPVTNLNPSGLVSGTTLHYPFTIDTNDPNYLGGFEFYLTRSYMIDKSISLDDIKTAWEAL